MSGYITYLKYTLGSNKGASNQGDVYNTPFSLAQMRNGERVPFDADYTSAKVVDTGTTPTDGKIHMHWNPVIPKTVKLTTYKADGTVDKVYLDVNGDGTFYNVTGKSVSTKVSACGNTYNVDVIVTPALTDTDKVTGLAVIYGKGSTSRTDGKPDACYGTSTAPNRGLDVAVNATVVGLTAGTNYELSYVYNNIYIPQNDLPLLNVEMDSIPLIAKARRIAINKYVA